MSVNRILIAIMVFTGLGCSLVENYEDPEGPRYAGDHRETNLEVPDELMVVTYNLKFAVEVERAIEVLSSAELKDADIVLMQEMDADAVSRIAMARSFQYVYYPGSVHETGRDFGNAILSRWPIVADHKLQTPHRDPIGGRRRPASAAVIQLPDNRSITIYSVHTEIISLGLKARLEQAEAVIDDALQLGGPVVIGGDFNTGDIGSGSQTRGLFREHGFEWLSDQQRDTAEAYGRWWTLDYLFGRNLEGTTQGRFEGDTGSDHRPIWARIRI